MTYTVGQVAEASGVTIRTLHHYDEIGLVVPRRSDSGYRIYDEDSLDVLQQVLLLREVGLPLVAIADILADPGFDRRAALVRQRSLVIADLERTHRLVDTIDRAIATYDAGGHMTPDERFEGLSEHEAEAKRRWGHTDAYKESQRRVKSYSKDDIAAGQTEQEGIADRFGELMRSGVASDSDAAIAMAEAHRLHIDKWWYPCTKDMHANLGTLYVEDPGFTEFWDSREPGLAQYVNEAIAANKG